MDSLYEKIWRQPDEKKKQATLQVQSKRPTALVRRGNLAIQQAMHPKNIANRKPHEQVVTRAKKKKKKPTSGSPLSSDVSPGP